MTKAALLTALALLGQAAATTIPGTKVSYTLKTDEFTGGNASMVFIDAQEDASGQTYMTVACDLEDPYFRLYSKVPLGTYTGELITVFYQTDQGSFKSATGKLREDFKSGKLTVIDFRLYESTLFFRSFSAAQKQVSMRVSRNGLAPLNLTFLTKGFLQGFRAVRSCE